MAVEVVMRLGNVRHQKNGMLDNAVMCQKRKSLKGNSWPYRLGVGRNLGPVLSRFLDLRRYHTDEA